MNRLSSWLIIVFAISVLCANLLLVRPPVDAPAPKAAPVAQVIPPPMRSSVPSPFAYIHEDGSEEYLPSGVSFEEERAAGGFAQTPARDSRAAVFSWSSAEDALPVSGARIWR